jgi:hypothetical protein
MSNGESPDSNPSSRHDVKEIPPEPRKFWWMKEKPQIEKTPTETASNRSFSSGASGEGVQLEGGYATISPTIKNISVAKVPAVVSPDISSSMADFLEKEKLCKVSKKCEIIKYCIDYLWLLVSIGNIVVITNIIWW